MVKVLTLKWKSLLFSRYFKPRFRPNIPALEFAGEKIYNGLEIIITKVYMMSKQLPWIFLFNENL